MPTRDEMGPGLPMRAVIERTGLNADVLRAWERRYAAVRPRRTAGGHRLYAPDDVERLTLLRAATLAGHSIAEIARLDASALEALVEPGPDEGGEPSDQAVDLAVAAAIAATQRLDAFAVESALRRGALLLGVRALVDRIVGAFLTEVGNRWHSGAISPAHEHLASAAARKVLEWAMDAYEPARRAPKILVGTPQGEHHELGAMLAAAAATEEGWRVAYLGPDLPARAIADAARQIGARAVALSVVFPNGDGALKSVRELARLLPQDIRLVVGGAAVNDWSGAAGLSKKGVRIAADMPAFRKALRTLRGSTRLSDDES